MLRLLLHLGQPLLDRRFPDLVRSSQPRHRRLALADASSFVSFAVGHLPQFRDQQIVQAFAIGAVT